MIYIKLPQLDFIRLSLIQICHCFLMNLGCNRGSCPKSILKCCFCCMMPPVKQGRGRRCRVKVSAITSVIIVRLCVVVVMTLVMDRTSRSSSGRSMIHQIVMIVQHLSQDG